MVGRQTPILAVVVPLILVFVVDGRRGVRQTWLPALVCGAAFGARPVRRRQLHLGAAGRHRRRPGRGRGRRAAAAGVDAGRGAHRRPRRRRGGRLERADAPAGPSPAARRATSGRRRRVARRPAPAPASAAPLVHDSRAEVVQGLRAVRRDHRDLLDRQHHGGQGVPRRGAVRPSRSRGRASTSSTPAGEPVATTTFSFNWLPAAGTLMILAGLITHGDPQGAPGRGAAHLRPDLRRAAVGDRHRDGGAGLAYVMNLSGQTASLGAWLAGAGGRLRAAVADPGLAGRRRSPAPTPPPTRCSARSRCRPPPRPGSTRC